MAAPAHADCARDAEALRAHLLEASHAARTWNLAWAIAFGGAAAIQVTLAAAEVNPFGKFTAAYQDTLYVGAAKASVGAAARLVMPLRVDVPAANSDRCAELAALRGSLTAIAKKERQTFWLTHLGGLALNLSGAFLLWHRRTLAVGATSFAISFPIGPLSAYTLPRASWHLWRAQRASWSVGLDAGHGRALVTLGVEL